MHYLYNMREPGRAKELIDSMPKINYFHEFLYPECLDNKIDKQKACQIMICDHSHVVVGAIRCYVESNQELTTVEKANLIKKCNSLYEILFESEYDYDMLVSNCLKLSEYYVELNDIESVMKNLELCVEYSKKFDAIKKLPYSTTYDTEL